MIAFALPELLDRHAAARERYREFLRRSSFSLGLYVLPAGADDTQRPHAEDEVYFVVSGRARFRCGEADREVGPNDLLFVEAYAAHRFHAIEEDLTLLVFFAPADSG